MQYSCQVSKHLLSLWNKAGLQLLFPSRTGRSRSVGVRKLIGLGLFFLKYERIIMYSMAILKHCSYFARTCSAVAIGPSRSAHNTRLWSDVWSSLLLSCQEGDNYLCTRSKHDASNGGKVDQWNSSSFLKICVCLYFAEDSKSGWTQIYLFIPLLEMWHLAHTIPTVWSNLRNKFMVWIVKPMRDWLSIYFQSSGQSSLFCSGTMLPTKDQVSGQNLNGMWLVVTDVKNIKSTNLKGKVFLSFSPWLALMFVSQSKVVFVFIGKQGIMVSLSAVLNNLCNM